MKLIYNLIIVLQLGLFATLSAQAPDGYYNTTDGKSGYELKTALHQIIKAGHLTQTYTSLWTHFVSTDAKTDGTVWDMYSDVPGGTPPYIYNFTIDQCGNYSGEGVCYNREHSFPKSWFDDASPMYTELYHIYPTDGYVNSIRSNYPFGEVDNPTKTSQNGSKVGPNATPGYTGTVFEPIDAYKGDFARTYFYMATRYEDVIAGWESYSPEGNNVLDGSSDKVFEQWTLDLFLAWHKQDPVSEKETNRNNAVYAIQKNRNPYIDHPWMVECVWLNECDPNPVYETEAEQADVTLLHNPESKAINLYWNHSPFAFVKVYDLSGRLVMAIEKAESGITISRHALKQGFYLFTIQFSDGSVSTQKSYL